MLLHQPDINGTHAPLDTPLSEKTQALFREWTSRGHIFAPNTSYTIVKIARNTHRLANGPYITELGVAVHDADAETLLAYHPLSRAERADIAAIFRAQAHAHVQTAAFFPKFEKGDSHGMRVFIHPGVSPEHHAKLLSRHHAVEHLTSDPSEFATWIADLSQEFGMLEWKPLPDTNVKEFLALNHSYDSGGTFFLTPRGVNKATTFQKLITSHYRHIPASNISIAGDSKPTDGPLFSIPGILHIAVADRSLLQEVPGRNLYADTPEAADRYLEQLMRHNPTPTPEV